MSCPLGIAPGRGSKKLLFSAKTAIGYFLARRALGSSPWEKGRRRELGAASEVAWALTMSTSMTSGAHTGRLQEALAIMISRLGSASITRQLAAKSQASIIDSNICP